MTLDTRTPAEIAYDATSLYLKPTPPTNPSPLLIDLVDWADEQISIAEDDRITLAKEADRLLAMDGGENDPRFDQAIDQMAALPDDLRARGVVMLEQFLAGGAIDERFDRAIDGLDDLPEARRAAGLSLVEGFLTGVAMASRDEQESPESLVKLLEKIEAHFERKRAAA